MFNNVSINNIEVKKVSSTGYLGVILDENLNWVEHIEKLNKCLIKTSNSFKIIKHRVNENNKHVLFNSYILSKIEYGIEAYGKASCTALNKVQVQQNRALKILFNKDYFTHTQTLHKDLDKLLVKDIYKLSISKFVYKFKKELLPDIFDKTFISNSLMHQHNTRQKHSLHRFNPGNNLGELKISHQGSIFWNSLPLKVRESKSLKSFSNKVKKFHLEQYN